MLTCVFAKSPQLTRFAEADLNKAEVHTCKNMQPEKRNEV